MDKLTIKTENIVLKLNTGSIIVSGGNVQSVNGRTGNIILNANDVGAATPQDVADLRDYTETQFTAFNNSINALVLRTTTLEGNYTVLGNRTTTLENSVQGLNITITDLNARVDQAQSEVSTLRGTVADQGVLVGRMYDGMVQLGQDIAFVADNKLDRSEYVQHFKGLFPSYAALTAAYPSAEDGDYAHIDSGSGFDRMAAIWDSSDVKWVVQGTEVGANTDEVPEGSTNLYFKSERVLTTTLTGYTVGTDTPLGEPDTILGALGKLQAQVLAFPSKVMSTVVGTFTSPNVAVTFTDTLVTSIGKLQGQINSIGTKVLATFLTGMIKSNSAIVGTDNILTAFGKAQGQLDYILGLNQIFDFSNAVQSTALSTYVVGANTAVVSSDSLVGAVGKLQGQIGNINTTFGTKVRSTTLTGLTGGTSTPISASDTIVEAFGKVINQVGAINSQFNYNVRQTDLYYLDVSQTTAINALDNVLSAFGKAQGQINQLKAPTWVSVKTLTGIAWHGGVDVANSTIEVAKIGGMLWVRGWLRNTGTLFSTVPLVSWTQATWLIDVTGMGYGSAYGHFAGGVVSMHSSNDTGYYRVTARQGQNLIYNGLYLALDSTISSVGILPILPMCLGKAF